MTLFRSLLFWLSRPPDTDPTRMNYTMWNNFLDLIAGLLVISVGVSVLAAVIGYMIHTRRRRIVYPTDYFTTYTPLRWPMLLAIIPAAIVFWRYIAEFKRMFGSSPVSPIGAAVQVTVWTWLLSYLASRLLVMLPVITPKKFRYRPLQWFIRGGRPQIAAGR